MAVPANEVHPSRYFADVYDSIRQAAHMSWNDEQLAIHYLARLRLDCLLCRTTVLTDSELLDGVFFLSAAERPLFEELPIERLEIRTRAASLEESLLRFLRSKDQDKLRGYAFSSLPVDFAHE